MNSKEDEKAAALAAYNSVVADAKLDDIILISSSFSVKPEYYAVTRSGESAQKIKRGFNNAFSMFTYNPEKLILGGQFDWVIEVSQSKKKILNVKASYVITYSNVPDVGNIHIEAFVKRVGKFATYPYFRSLVSQFSWASQIDLPILPVLK